MAALHGLILHGGAAGVIVEVSAALAIVAIAVAVWVSQRRDREEP